jgi:hypothetical protein
MFGMLIVSFCGVALPIATGVWLAPSGQDREPADAPRAATARAVAWANLLRRPAWAAAVQPEGFPAGIGASSAGPFGGNLASGS